MTQGENKRLKKPFEGEVFVFTGTMKMERDEATMKVIELGGRCTKALSGKTTCLVTGDEPGPSKVKKAEKLGIRVEDEEQFMRRLHTAMGKLETKIEPEKDAYASIEKIEIGVNEESEFDFSIKSETGAETKQAEFVNWAEKYRPQKSSEIIGNPTAIGEVRDFLESGSSEALFISGSPGLGKTTTVHVLCNELGISMIEFNGSDLRNKKGLDKNVRSKLEGGSVLGIQRVIVMDEVDGMSSDRGGIAELIKIVKESSIPIICIANDRTHPKLRTLMSHCNEVKFRKPVISSVLPRLKSILKTEGKYLPENVLTEIVLGCNQDIRYVINTMQKNCDIKDVRQLIIDKKDVARNTFELASEIFKRMPVNRKIDLFFEDYHSLSMDDTTRLIRLNTVE
ncbi:RFC1 [Enterospora canceri]|uniref:RFC1 n=1 Tax=Enterospora canceri TaxID=1081671 RepID=A0A1Y1S7C3_9MICR|nr:RFC1 [Enterospora canceri]